MISKLIFNKKKKFMDKQTILNLMKRKPKTIFLNTYKVEVFELALLNI